MYVSWSVSVNAVIQTVHAALVLRLLCSNPHGLFWAGGMSVHLSVFSCILWLDPDTAQTISVSIRPALLSIV